MKVLLVEDTVTSATLVCNMLGKIGLTPLVARDGESGLEVFKRERPDLVLLDIILPGIDGFEVARCIRQFEARGEWTPIVFLSARASDEDVRRGIEVGGDDYLIKPVSEIVLIAKLRAMQRIAGMRESLLMLTRRLNEANLALTRLSSVDGLTGLANRRCFDDALQKEWLRGVRNAKPLSLIIADVDYFKQFNDGYGHQVGDECLKAVAQVLQGCVSRAADVVARYGGEEFVAILPETDENGAMMLAETMRERMEGKRISHRFSQVAPVVTLSAGVATTVPVRGDDAGFMNLLRAADQALYQAKQEGRNRVVALPVVVPSAAF